MTLTTFRNYAVAVALIAQVVSTAQADPIIQIPGSTTFGPLPSATFGGTGISNSSVAITTIQDRGNTITLGMTAVGRYFNPPVGSNGAGDFYATVGLNNGLGGPGPVLGATWNFGFYIDVAGGAHLGDYDFSLLYDVDPASANGESTHGTLLLSNAISNFGLNGATRVQDSQNLFFGLFSTVSPFVLLPSGSFDPFATGEYTFSLRATNHDNVSGESNIRVTVNTVPEPSTIALIALSMLSLFGFGALRRRGVA